MNLLAWFSPTRWLILAGVVAALGASVLGYGEWRAHAATASENQRWELAVGKMKAEAAGKLATETGAVLRLERQLGLVTEQLEKEHAERKATSEGYERRLAAAAAGGRLRDPNAPRCGSGGGSPASAVAAGSGGGAPGAASDGGLLSVELTGLLREQARRADEVNDAYAACRSWAMTVKDKLDEFSRAMMSPPELEAANHPAR